MKKHFFVFAALLSVCGVSAMAQDFDFRSANPAEVSELQNKINYALARPNSYLFPPTDCPIDSDVPPAIQKQMRDDMAFMATVQGSAGSALHQQIFGPVNGETYVNFFRTRVKGVGMSACGGGNAVACVIPMVASSKMWLTQNYIKFSHPQISRLMVVFHESRHTERQNGNWGHARCPRPFLDPNGNEYHSIWTGATLSGEAACDVTPYGSYGSSLIMLKNIQKFCTSCTNKVRMDAGLYADDQFTRITDPGARKAIQQDLY